MICLTVPKNAVGESFSLLILSDIEKVWMRGWCGGSQGFSLKVSPHSAKKFRRATL